MSGDKVRADKVRAVMMAFKGRNYKEGTIQSSPHKEKTGSVVVGREKIDKQWQYEDEK